MCDVDKMIREFFPDEPISILEDDFNFDDLPIDSERLDRYLKWLAEHPEERIVDEEEDD